MKCLSFLLLFLMIACGEEESLPINRFVQPLKERKTKEISKEQFLNQAEIFLTRLKEVEVGDTFKTSAPATEDLGDGKFCYIRKSSKQKVLTRVENELTLKKIEQITLDPDERNDESCKDRYKKTKLKVSEIQRTIGIELDLEQELISATSLKILQIESANGNITFYFEYNDKDDEKGDLRYRRIIDPNGSELTLQRYLDLYLIEENLFITNENYPIEAQEFQAYEREASRQQQEEQEEQETRP